MTIPIEFVAEGRPSSVNATSGKKQAWKAAVNRAAADELTRLHSPKPFPGVHSGDVTVKVFYFRPTDSSST